MGCWYGTCLISKLSIKEGTPVVCVPLVYVYDKWCSCLPPVFGEYNDYGALKNIEESNYTRRLELAFAKAQLSLNHKKCNENPNLEPICPSTAEIWLKPQFEYCSYQKPLTEITIEDIVSLMEREACRKNVLYVKVMAYRQKWARMSMCLVRRDIYDYMVNKKESHCYDLKDLWDLSENSPNFELRDKLFQIKQDLNFKTLCNFLHLSKITDPTDLTLIVNFFRFLDYTQKYLRMDLDLPAQAGSQHNNHKDINSLCTLIKSVIKKEKEDAE